MPTGLPTSHTHRDQQLLIVGQEHLNPCQKPKGRSAEPSSTAHLDKLTEAKVSKLGIGGSRIDASQQHVLQLQVSMDHHGSQAVQVLECRGDLMQPPEGI